ncbi:outer membrane protein, adhesin transport system [Sulfurivirga caldicuralii]|uniref:Outer membrane protein, adhesin transport system n=1 Tax=Sulfurivirga caldicuralii TaxID=364032 RepID=A0A1N6GET0_9GAMM|nr:TolC family outer membrane protein [Sulfurivirga caldicuralii]SIO06023.1 outer membrane protein, adhesin transport system [Sulfurivirga caldicuralii]
MRQYSITPIVCGLLISCSTWADTLPEAIKDGLKLNPEVRAELAKYRAYRYDLREGKADYYLQIDLNAGIGYEEYKSPTVSKAKGLTRQELAIKLTQNLFRGFATQNNVKRLQARLDAQGLYAESVVSDIALEISKAYLDILRSQELVQLGKLNVENHKKIFQQIKMRFDSGLSDEVELDQAKARYALAQSNLLAQKSKLADALARYHRLVGHDAPRELSLPTFDYKIPPDLETAIKIALTDHPRLLSAYADVAEAKAQAFANKGNFYPTVNLEVEKRWDRNTNGVKGSTEDFQAMVRMNYNLYKGGADEAKYKSTVALYQQAMEIRNRARREVMEDLRYAWDTMTMAQNQLQYLDQHIQLTRSTLLGYRKQFALGRRSLLDLLNTENEYNQALTKMTETRYDLLQAQYRVVADMGHLLDMLKINYDVKTAAEKAEVESSYLKE